MHHKAERASDKLPHNFNFSSKSNDQNCQHKHLG